LQAAKPFSYVFYFKDTHFRFSLFRRGVVAVRPVFGLLAFEQFC
jgi:hypothetical protein